MTAVLISLAFMVLSERSCFCCSSHQHTNRPIDNCFILWYCRCFASIVIVSKIQGFVCLVLNPPRIKLKVMPETQRNSSSSPYGPCMCNGNSPRRAAVLLLTLVDIEMYPLEADTVRLSAVVCLCSVLLCVPCVCVC